MAEVNKCSQLMSSEQAIEAQEKYAHVNAFQTMYDMQNTLQQMLHEKLPLNNPNPNNLETVGEIFDYVRENKQAIDDEYRELVDALPGMSLPEKERSALWKRWKSNHNGIRDIKFSDLSEEDKYELQFECCDILHFYLNMMIALKITPQQMFTMYYAKNNANAQRYANGY